MSKNSGSLDEFLTLADASGRLVPYLFLTPFAAGHLKPPAQILAEGNNALWHYTLETSKEARSRDVDVLNLYNLTIQASSWDGSAYGQEVSLVAAMMVRLGIYDLAYCRSSIGSLEQSLPDTTSGNDDVSFVNGRLSQLPITTAYFLSTRPKRSNRLVDLAGSLRAASTSARSTEPLQLDIALMSLLSCQSRDQMAGADT